MLQEKENTQTRLKYLMNTRNIKQIDILNMCKPYCRQYGVKMNKSDLSQYVSGKVEPSQSKLVILGMALNVNEAWLMGFDVPMEREPDSSATTSVALALNKQENTLISLYRQLNDDGQDILLDTADTLVSSKKYQQSDTFQTEKQA